MVSSGMVNAGRTSFKMISLFADQEFPEVTHPREGDEVTIVLIEASLVWNFFRSFSG